MNHERGWEGGKVLDSSRRGGGRSSYTPLRGHGTIPIPSEEKIPATCVTKDRSSNTHKAMQRNKVDIAYGPIMLLILRL